MRALVVLLGVALVGCGGGASPSASPAPSVAPASSPVLELTVFPPEEPTEVRMAIPGQRCIFLVRVEGGPPDQPIEVTATASGGSVEVAPEDIEPGQIAEVTVIPGPVTSEASVDVMITARRGDAERAETRSIPVFPETDTLAQEAADRLVPFAAWLATERPDIGITSDTQWQGTALQPRLLVVSHYLFLSEEWEAALEWHIMIAPSDWSRLILRHRWTEMTPSLAFEIPSVSSGDAPREIEPPEVMPR